MRIHDLLPINSTLSIWKDNNFIVYIENHDYPDIDNDCVGTLIKENIVVTSINCVYNFDLKQYYSLSIFYFDQPNDFIVSTKIVNFEYGLGRSLNVKKADLSRVFNLHYNQYNSFFYFYF